MDYDESKQIEVLCLKSMDIANEYAECLKEATQLLIEYERIYCKEIIDIKKDHKGIGYDMGRLLINGRNEEARVIDEEYKKKKAICDGYKQILDTMEQAISMKQSLLRYERVNA